MNNQSRGPQFSGTLPTLEEIKISQEKSRKEGFRIKAEQSKKKDEARLKKQKEINDKVAEIKKKFDGCWIAPDGSKHCKDDKHHLFVSPKQFAKNIDNFIMEDLPGALTVGLTAASLGLGPGVVPLGLAIGLKGLGQGISAQRAGGFGPGATKRKKRNRL